MVKEWATAPGRDGFENAHIQTFLEHGEWPGGGEEQDKPVLAVVYDHRSWDGDRIRAVVKELAAQHPHVTFIAVDHGLTATKCPNADYLIWCVHSVVAPVKINPFILDQDTESVLIDEALTRVALPKRWLCFVTCGLEPTVHTPTLERLHELLNINFLCINGSGAAPIASIGIPAAVNILLGACTVDNPPAYTWFCVPARAHVQLESVKAARPEEVVLNQISRAADLALDIHGARTGDETTSPVLANASQAPSPTFELKAAAAGEQVHAHNGTKRKLSHLEESKNGHTAPLHGCGKRMRYVGRKKNKKRVWFQCYNELCKEAPKTLKLPSFS